MTNLFEQSNESNNERKSIQFSAVLATMASKYSTSFMTKLNEEIDNHRNTFEASKTDNDVLGRLIEALVTIEDDDLTEASLVTLEETKRIVASQQSKSSRLKSKEQTQFVYLGRVSAKISEMIMRKSHPEFASASRGRRTGCVSLPDLITEELLPEFEADQEKLGKAIRNYQSKLSILKRKQVDESDERWERFRSNLELLKTVRKPGQSSQYSSAIAKVDKVTEVLSEVEDYSKLTAKQAKEMLLSIAGQLKPSDE